MQLCELYCRDQWDQVHHSGRSNHSADALSHSPLLTSDTIEEEESLQVAIVQSSNGRSAEAESQDGN